MGELAQTQVDAGEKLAVVLKPRPALAAPQRTRKTAAKRAAVQAGTHR